jgi:phenylacetate-CoA ligase
MKTRTALDLAGPRWRRIPRMILQRPVDWILRLVGPRYRVFFWIITRAPAKSLARLGRWRAVRAREHAIRRVPAYSAFLSGQAYPTGAKPFTAPYTDKDNYVRAFSTEARCVGGELMFDDAAIDESSGSSGTPYNWVRSLQERQASHIFISHFARYCFGDAPWITINAFSMGAWATGLNMGIALQRNSLVKSTGPDLGKIFSTLDFFGPDHTYLVCGYPPFLKLMIDEAAKTGFPLDKYHLMALVGGEGMSEGLRDYLTPTFAPVFSGYGATDLEIGIAGETPIAVAVRRAARTNEGFRRAVFGADSRLPMVFQYNPLQHHITTTEDDELVFTISRLELLSPRIMYNVHDEGGVATFSEMMAKAEASGLRLREQPQLAGRLPQLPFVWVYGRSDSTVSVMGANVYPEDIEESLYAEPDLARLTRSYCLGMHENPDGGWRVLLSFEIEGDITDQLRTTFAERITARLEALNKDFREAMKEHPEGAIPLVELHPLSTGPFAADSGKIKQRRTTGPIR